MKKKKSQVSTLSTLEPPSGSLSVRERTSNGAVGGKFSCHNHSEHKHWFDGAARRGTKCGENSAANCPRCQIGSTLMSTSVRRWGARGASVPDRRGGRVARDSQPTRSDAGDPRCISIESLTRQTPAPQLPPAQPISKRASGKALSVTADWMTALSRVDKRRGRRAANRLKMTKTDRPGGRAEEREGKVVVGVGGLAPTHLASLCCRIVAFFATVILGMNHGVTHILPPGRCAFEPIPLFDVHSLQARASQRPVYRDVLVFFFLFILFFFKITRRRLCFRFAECLSVHKSDQTSLPLWSREHGIDPTSR